MTNDWFRTDRNAETKEQLAGVFVIDVPDLDTALEWAARYPGKVVEVRPNLPTIE